MRLEDLTILCAVIAEGSIAKAAVRLHRVPSGVTARIKDLERELGKPLFTRTGKSIRPTAAGIAAATQAKAVVAAVETLRAAIVDRPVPQRLRVGTLESTAALRMPAALAHLQREHPEVAIELRVANGRELLSMMLADELDAALIGDPPSDHRFAIRQLFSDTLVLVAPARHLPIRKPTDVKPLTLVVFRPGCVYRARLESWCARGGLVPNRLVEVGSFHAVIGCVAAGMGIALVPEALVAIHPGRAHVSIHPLPKGTQRIRHAMVWRKNAPSAPAEWLADVMSP